MPFPFKLPPDSEPIIRNVGLHPALCLAVGFLCLGLIALAVSKVIGG